MQRELFLNVPSQWYRHKTAIYMMFTGLYLCAVACHTQVTIDLVDESGVVVWDPARTHIRDLLEEMASLGHVSRLQTKGSAQEEASTSIIISYFILFNHKFYCKIAPIFFSKWRKIWT